MSDKLVVTLGDGRVALCQVITFFTKDEALFIGDALANTAKQVQDEQDESKTVADDS